MGSPASLATDPTVQALGQAHAKDPWTIPKGVAGYVGDRYGSIDKALATGYTDPIGAASDISTVATLGGGAAAKAPGTVGKIGRAVAAAGEMADPLSWASKVEMPPAGQRFSLAAEAGGSRPVAVRPTGPRPLPPERELPPAVAWEPELPPPAVEWKPKPADAAGEADSMAGLERAREPNRVGQDRPEQRRRVGGFLPPDEQKAFREAFTRDQIARMSGTDPRYAVHPLVRPHLQQLIEANPQGWANFNIRPIDNPLADTQAAHKLRQQAAAEVGITVPDIPDDAARPGYFKPYSKGDPRAQTGDLFVPGINAPTGQVERLLRDPDEMKAFLREEGFHGYDMLEARRGGEDPNALIARQTREALEQTGGDFRKAHALIPAEQKAARGVAHRAARDDLRGLNDAIRGLREATKRMEMEPSVLRAADRARATNRPMVGAFDARD
jgi:hypothetical protein